MRGRIFGVGRLLDYGARYYDARLSRFLSVDPMADSPANISFSPYHYVWNNPIRFIDPTGMHGESTHVDEKGNVIAEFDDGDDGVYVHQNGTGSTVSQNYSADNTSAGGKHIGDLGGVINIDGIYSTLLSENMETADGMWDPRDFRDLVRNRGDWDYKSRKNTIYGLGNDGATKFSFEGNLMESQDIGNHHFGAVAQEFGFPELTALRQAGAAQMSAGTSRPEWQRYETIEMPGIKPGQTMSRRTMVAPYGDDPRDQGWIRAGYNFARR